MIYVDEIREYELYQIHPSARRFGVHWCHLFIVEDDKNTLEELHKFAEKIGLKRSWFQNKHIPHYDLIPSKRAIAVQLGAKEVTAWTVGNEENEAIMTQRSLLYRKRKNI